MLKDIKNRQIQIFSILKCNQGNLWAVVEIDGQLRAVRESLPGKFQEIGFLDKNIEHFEVEKVGYINFFGMTMFLPHYSPTEQELKFQFHLAILQNDNSAILKMLERP